MNCRICHQEIPNSPNGTPLLDCPRCLADKSYQALLQFQRQFITRMLKGEHLVTLVRPPKQVKWHLTLANYSQAWCGERMKSCWRRERLAYPRIDTGKTPLCESCHRVFQELAEDQPTEVA